VSFFDLVGELRTGTPSPRKAEMAMKVLGWGCLVGGVWNAGVIHLTPLEKLPLRLPDGFPWAALVSFTLLGVCFLAAARGIREHKRWGRTLGQFGILALVGLLLGFGGAVFLPAFQAFFRGAFALVLAAFCVLFTAQFAVPAFFGIRYLGRLPVGDPARGEDRFRPKGAAAALQARELGASNVSEEKYRDALLPGGILGTFALLLGVPLALGLAVVGAAGPERLPWFILPALLLVFGLPVAYNFARSPFQERRTAVAVFTGGGSTFLFSGSWPFFRLLMYDDGLEVRVMLNRFFVPYDRMEEPPEKVGFFSRGLLIRSDLPGVPSRIRFYGARTKKIVHLVRGMHRRFKEGQVSREPHDGLGFGEHI